MPVRARGGVLRDSGGALKRERREHFTALHSLLSSRLHWGWDGRLQWAWDGWGFQQLPQEVTLRMEATCQERGAGRQKSEGVPHDWELPISLDNALGTPLTQERQELPPCSNHGRFGFSVTWRNQTDHDSKKYIRCCLFGGEENSNLRVTVFFSLMIWVLILISVILAVMLKTLNTSGHVFKKNLFRFYCSEYGLLSHINTLHESMKKCGIPDLLYQKLIFIRSSEVICVHS